MTRKLLLVAFLALACAMLADRLHPTVDAGVAGDTILISLQNGEDALTPPFAAGTLGNGDSINASMSANGRFIVFESLASNLLTGGGVVDNNNSSDIFLRDVQNNTIELISVNNAGTASGCFNGAAACTGAGNLNLSDSQKPTISDDGCRIAFMSKAGNLAPAPAVDANGATNAYLRIRGGPDCGGGAATTRLIDKIANTACPDTNGFQTVVRDASIAASGNFVAYTGLSAACPDATDANGIATEIYLYTVASDSNQRVNLMTGSNTPKTSGDAELATVSSDGCRIVWQSTENIVAPDVITPQTQIVMRERRGAAGCAPGVPTTTVVSRNTAGNFDNQSAATDAQISANGLFVTFNSNSTVLNPVVLSDIQAHTFRILTAPAGADFTPRFTNGCAFSTAGAPQTHVSCPTSSATFTLGYNHGYLFNVTAKGAATPTFTCVGCVLPAGLTFLDLTLGAAQITGAPTVAPGIYGPFIIRATNSAGSTDQSFTITVAPAPAPGTPPTWITPDNQTLVSQENFGGGIIVNGVGGDSLRILCGPLPNVNINPGLDQSCGGEMPVGVQAGLTDNGGGQGNIRGTTWSATADTSCPVLPGAGCTVHFKIQNQTGHIFVRDLAGSTTSVADVIDGTNTPGGYFTSTPTISNDGRYVAFASSNPDLGGAIGRQDIFMRDRIGGGGGLCVAPCTRLVSLGQGNVPAVCGLGTPCNHLHQILGVRWLPRLSMSSDGRFITWTSTAANLVGAGNDTNNRLDVFRHQLINDPQPNLTVTKTNTTAGNVVQGSPFSWVVTVTNTGLAAATFPINSHVLTDSLPAGLPYPANATALVTNGSGTVSCPIVADVMTCSASGGPVVLNALNGQVQITITVNTTNATPPGAYTNPPIAGNCKADPGNPPSANGIIAESNEADNLCPQSGPVNVVAPGVNTATFTVSKDFIDNSAGTAQISLSCTNATVDLSPKPATEVPNAPAVFNLSNVLAGATCTATEAAIPGYALQSTTCVANTAVAAGGTPSCAFVNTPTAGATLFTVSKDFTDNGTGVAQISLSCTGATPDAASKPASENPNSPAVFLISAIAPGATCTATEGAIAGYTQQSTTCTAGMPVTTGVNSGCAFVNAPAPGGSADVSLTKTGGAGTLTPGANVTYTLTLTNNGPGTANNVVVTDPVPANTTFVAASQSSGPAFTMVTPPVGGTGNVQFSNVSVANGAIAVFSITVQVNPGTPNGTPIINTATATSTSDPTPGNNSPTVSGSVLSAGGTAPTATPTATPSATPTPVTANVPPRIPPQIFQNPAAMGVIYGNRSTPVPSSNAARSNPPQAGPPARTGGLTVPVITPPRTGDAGLQLDLPRLRAW